MIELPAGCVPINRFLVPPHPEIRAVAFSATTFKRARRFFLEVRMAHVQVHRAVTGIPDNTDPTSLVAVKIH
jgi:hypothetical protein